MPREASRDAASCWSTTTSSSGPACATSSAALVDIVGEAGTVAEAVPLIRELDPDVVLLDVHLPDGGGEAVIAAVAPERPGGEVPGAVRLRRGRGRDRRHPRRRARLRDEDDLERRARRRGRPGRRTATPCSRRASPASCSTRSARASRSAPTRSSTTLTRARARGPAADRARLPLQGDRRAAPPLGEDDRGARVERPAQAAALVAARAHPLGARAPADLSSQAG